jgi:hypothetical protein
MADTESAVAELPPAGVRPRHTTLSPHNAGETRVRSSGSNGGSGSTLGLTSFTHQQTRDVQTRREVVSFTTRTPQLSPAHVAPTVHRRCCCLRRRAVVGTPPRVCYPRTAVLRRPLAVMSHGRCRRRTVWTDTGGSAVAIRRRARRRWRRRRRRRRRRWRTRSTWRRRTCWPRNTSSWRSVAVRRSRPRWGLTLSQFRLHTACAAVCGHTDGRAVGRRERLTLAGNRRAARGGARSTGSPHR